MHDLNYELKQLCARNRDGSYTTQANRERILMLIANQLREMGFVNMRAQSLKPKWLVQGADRRRADAMLLATPNSAPAAVHPFCDFSTAADTALPRYDKDDLRDNRMRAGLRLEQEHISFHWLAHRLQHLLDGTAAPHLGILS